MPTAPDRREQYLTLGAVAAGFFSVQLALMPISAILPSLAQALGADLPTASWIIIGYLLAMSAFLLLAGRLGDLIGHGTLFLIGSALFTVASLASGQAQNASQLILFRAFQGLGSAFVSGNGLALIAGAFPAQERGRAIGVITMTTGLGSFTGVLLAAFFLSYLSWRWNFYLPTLTGLVATFLIFRVRRGREVGGLQTVDWVGAGGLFLVMLTLFLGMNHYHSGGSDEAYHVVFLGVFVVLAVVFVWIERRRPDPLFEVRHFAHLPFTASVISNGILHMTMMGVFFLVPFLVEKVMGLPPLYSSITLALSVLPSAVFALIGGWLHDRFHSAWQQAGTMAVIALGLFGMAFVGTDYGLLITLATALGVMMGLFLSSNNTVVVTSLPFKFRGFASGMLETTRQFGHGLAVSLASAVIGASLPGASLVAGEPTPFLAGFRNTAFAMAAVAGLGVLACLVRARATAQAVVETTEVETTTEAKLVPHSS